MGRMDDVPAAGQGYVTTCPPAASIEMPRKKNKDAEPILILVLVVI